MDKNDMISRAALLKECAECQKTDPHFEERGWANHFINSAGEPSTEWYCVEDMIENTPAVDAVPMVHGWWKDRHVCGIDECTVDNLQSARCTNCGKYHTTPYMYYFDDFAYCPYCGAKMDGERRDT